MRQPKGPDVTELLLTPFPSREMDQRFLELAEQQLRWERWGKELGVQLPPEQRFEQRVGIARPFAMVAGIQTSVATGVVIALGSGILAPHLSEKEWIAFGAANVIGAVVSSVTGMVFMGLRLEKLYPKFFLAER